MKIPHLMRRQRGFAMLEVSLALIITAFAALGTIKANAQAQRLEFAAIQGDGLRIARDAGETYAQENYTALQNGGAVIKNGYTVNPGTANGQTYSPAVADLIGLGYLPTGFSVQGSFSNGQAPGAYQFRLQRTPAGCELVPPGASCDITGLVYLDQPIRAAGSTEPDGPAISSMASKLGGNAGFTLLPTPTQIIGPNGVWPEPNPLPGSPSGVIAARFGFGSSGLGQFVRINDSRDPNLQGNLSVAGTAAVGGDLTSNGTVKGTTITATGNVNGDQYITAIKTVGAPCSTNGALASGSGVVMVCTGGTWQVQTGERSNVGTACSPNGKTATSITTQETIVCRSGVYVGLANLLARTVEVSRQIVIDGNTVEKAACPGGLPNARMIPLTWAVDVAAAPPIEGVYMYPQDNGATWYAQISVFPPAPGAWQSGNVVGAKAMLINECTYN